VVLKENNHYWEISLNNLEPILDEYYILDNLIITDDILIERADKLRELIITYCVLLEKDQQDTETINVIFNDIYTIITTVNNIQYHEFIAFWKVLDISHSVFKKLKEQRKILKEILKKYCEKRRKYYDNLGYSNITVQALYDVGSSRKKGNSANIKLENIIKNTFKNVVKIQKINDMKGVSVAFFFADRSGKTLFKEFSSNFNLKYEFGKSHQDKICDVVLKVNDHYFLIEAKHMKEGGGAQDKQIAEVIEFIKYSEDNNKFHYITFLDGVFFNKFSGKIKSNKIKIQKNDIELNLGNNKSNFFLNTYGLVELFKDISNVQDTPLKKGINKK